MTSMPNDETTRWTVSVSKETDLALRAFLGAKGMRKGDISKFVEEAVAWRMFDQTVKDVRDRFADLPPDELQELIDEACAAVRKDMFPPAPKAG
jgi:hypothetical protein